MYQVRNITWTRNIYIHFLKLIETSNNKTVIDIIRYTIIMRTSFICLYGFIMIRPAGSPTATLLRLLPGSNQCDQITSQFKVCIEMNAKNQSGIFSNQFSSGQRRAVCTKDRDVISVSWWLTLTWSSSFTNNNYNIRSPIRNNLTRLPISYEKGHTRCKFHCSARAAPDILGHHRPAIAGFLIFYKK
jgi:hypothetical protein